MGKHTSEFSDVSTVQCEFYGVSVGEENSREVSNSDLLFGKQTILQVGSSLQANNDFQPVCIDSGIKDGSLSPQYELVSRRGTDQGGAKADRMDLEGEGEADAAC